MKIESNLASVIQNLSFKITSLEDADKLFRTAAFDSVALISDRVQQDGLKTNDTPIKSFYSAGYGKKRRKAGLQTQFIDLTFSGDMMGDFIPATIIGGWAAGFRGEKASQKADWNEERFGTIFNLSTDELNVVTKGINDYINAALR